MTLVEMDYVELGVAWQASNLPELPPLFTWRNHSSLPADPERALEEAEDRLRARGLIRTGSVLDEELHAILEVFTAGSAEVDLRFAPAPGTEVRACAAARGDFAARAILQDDYVRLETIPAYSTIDALVGVLPAVPRPSAPVTSIPEADFDAAVAEAGENASDAAVLSGLRSRGISSDDARTVVRLLGGERRLYGKFGAAARDHLGRRHRNTQFTRVLDSAEGRSALYRRGGYLVIAPADHALLTRVVRELLDETIRMA
ncbi:EspG family protein [Streptoalloteichus tenebrarius]|uniref:EspG family protein n=1 Tax=Streptoalloteichus tenebrarius (strain ATCC 17920 / DSM 40477 / JCM 4838 / CBS 697.72 / NBRC 16177 / NCIMB 11028 / NRRL B-12390 / A12253. 1 / ISP 5477) TaxID=1933 RepID=A0ABT1I3U6_STRSD|nr:ESX secretion-associated protein EspG [Streptoalloteichus tenebrarius]MCP2262469.1 EspG family protein [Streptoalloteichus tenebrarius]BFF01343.1 ESX secretion-associated protein EspG [Streptoalloteichus tenebrarius]